MFRVRQGFVILQLIFSCQKAINELVIISQSGLAEWSLSGIGDDDGIVYVSEEIWNIGK